MSFPDTLSMLEGKVRQLEDARMQEARERDGLRSEVNRLRAVLLKVRAEVDLRKAPKLTAAIDEALGSFAPGQAPTTSPAKT